MDRRLVRLSIVLFAACADRAGGPPTSPEIAAAKGGPGVKSVTVSPSSGTIQVGQTLQLTGKTKPAAVALTWSTSNGGVAAVSSNGLVTGIAPGGATITASAGGKSGSAAITVVAVPPPPPPPPPGGVTFVGAGDIAVCGGNGDEATAALLDGIEGWVFTLGDNAYESGSITEYNNCYNPSWGRHKARTFPSPGNHEYLTAGAAGYYQYFGSAAGDPAKGYYSFDLGDWHIVVLNSNIARTAGSAQELWLRADLAASTKSCTLAYWHHPRFNSGAEHGNNTSVQPFWQALYDLNADLVLGGHEHTYERFAPQTPAGAADAVRGIRQFVVGTGGRELYGLGVRMANSEVFYNSTAGILRLTLFGGGYSWQFIPTSGGFTDSGAGTCH